MFETFKQQPNDAANQEYCSTSPVYWSLMHFLISSCQATMSKVLFLFLLRPFNLPVHKMYGRCCCFAAAMQLMGFSPAEWSKLLLSWSNITISQDEWLRLFPIRCSHATKYFILWMTVVAFYICSYATYYSKLNGRGSLLCYSHATISPAEWL